jgi:tetratricopeptide (TPR) repeat protein
VAGYFQPGEDVNYIALSTETEGEQTPYTIIFHEYVHLMINNSVDHNVPVWFNEGVAEYYSTFAIKDDIQVRLGNLINSHIFSLREKKLLPLRTLFTVDHKSPYYNERDKQNIFYAQSWLIMHYLFQGDGGKRLANVNKFFTSLDNGVELDKAFSDAFQMSIEQMEKELQQYLKKSSFNASILTFKQKLVFDAEIESSPITEADSQAYLGDLLAHQRYVTAEKHLQKAIELEPNHAMANASLGMFYAYQGRFAEARKFLEKAVAANSQSYLAHFYLAQAISFERMKQGYVQTTFSPDELKTMRASLKKAIELSPTFPESYRLLAFINLVSQDQIDESIALLKQALEISPGKQELNFMLAQCYMAKEDYNSAKQLLEPIARSSAKDETKEQAENLLNFIRQVEEKKAEYEAWRKKQEEQKKNAKSGQQTTDPVVLSDPTVETTDTSNNEKSKLKRKENPNEEPQTFQMGLHQPAEGESQVRGQFVRLDCVGTRSVVLVVKVGEKLYKLFKSDLANVRLVTFTTEVPLGGQVTCGALKNPFEVIATFTAMKDKNSKYDGEAVIIEFIPKDFPQKP